MEDIRSVLAQYLDPDALPPSRRQVNVRLGVDSYSKLEVLCNHLSVSKSRLASDLLTVAILQAYDTVTADAHPDVEARLDHDLNFVVGNLLVDEERS